MKFTLENDPLESARSLGMSRGSVYYLPALVCEADLALTQRLDELHLKVPFADSRMLRDLLWREGRQIGRKRVRTLMRRMGVLKRSAASPTQF